MDYVIIVVVALGMAAAAWLPWRRRRPLLPQRVGVLMVIVAAGLAAVCVRCELGPLGGGDKHPLDIVVH